jgi:hypothetical protein
MNYLQEVSISIQQNQNSEENAKKHLFKLILSHKHLFKRSFGNVTKNN